MAFYQTNLTDDWATVRGPGRLLVADVESVSIPTSIEDVIHTITYEAQGVWTDLGATKGGIQIDYQFTDPQVSINRLTKQVDTDYLSADLSASTALAENTFQSYQFAWNTSDQEDEAFTIGTPHKTPQKRIVVAYQDSSTELIRLYIFYRATITPTGPITLHKEGDQVTIPVRITAAPDLTQSDLRNRYMKITEQSEGVAEDAEDLVLI